MIAETASDNRQTAPLASEQLHVVFGAGPVGSAVARTLAAQGCRVRLVVRTARAVPCAPGVEVIAADAADCSQAIAACAGANVVYQCAAPPYHRWSALFPALQENILQGAARAGAVLVAVENLYGYGVAGDLTEQFPLVARTRKGAVRAAMSARLIKAHETGELRIVMARASDLFGPGVTASALGERFWPRLLAARSVAWFGDPDAPHSFTYVPDFAQMLVRLGREPAAWGCAWHAPSPPVLSMRSVIARAAARAVVKTPRIRRIPDLLLRAAGLIVPAAGELVELAYMYEQPWRMSHDAFTQTFGGEVSAWDPALDATISWWLGR
jgi:nucleoside-diphosphate-sugar epimerase